MNLPRPSRAQLRVLGALAAALFVSPLIASAPAYAHTELVTSNPADGAVLSAPPAQVTLTFTEEITARFSTFDLQIGDADPIALKATTSGKTLTLTVPASSSTATTAGSDEAPTWMVDYRVVSDDGHPVTGMIRFRAPLPQAKDASAPTTSTPSTDASPDGGSSTAASNPGAEQADSNDGSSGWLIAMIVGVPLLLIVIAIVAIRRRPRATSE